MVDSNVKNGFQNHTIRVLFLSIGTNYDSSIIEAQRIVNEKGFSVNVMSYNASNLNKSIEGNMDLFESIPNYDFVIIRSHADVYDYRYFDKIIHLTDKHKKSVLLECTQDAISEKYKDKFHGNEKERSYLLSLVKLGSKINWASVLLWIVKYFTKADIELPEPYVPPAQGIYISTDSYDPLEAIQHHVKLGTLNVALLFHQKMFVNGNTSWVGECVEIFSEQGVNLIPVFMITYKSDVLKSIGITGICDSFAVDGMPVVDAIVNTMSFSQKLLSSRGDDESDFFEKLNVPVIKVLLSDQSKEEWEIDVTGITRSQMVPNLNAPEFDGQIDGRILTVSETDPEGSKYNKILRERTTMIAKAAKAYALLRRKPNTEKKIAIIIYMYPPRMDLAGNAFGLDSFQSVSEILKAMNNHQFDTGGYEPDGTSLKDDLLHGVTNCLDYITDKDICSYAPGIVGLREYSSYLSKIPEVSRNTLCKNWGNPPGNVMVCKEGILIPGLIRGNVYIGFQPDRGKSTAESYHDAYTSMPHQYLAFYHWLKEDFKADAVIHVGTHGTVEWLPGKSAYLCEGCYPDLCMGHLPNIYPYIVDNPGEGIQSKRRSAATIITHNIPPMMRTRLYGYLKDLENLVARHRNAIINGATAEIESSYRQIVEILGENNLSELVTLDQDVTVDNVHDYILDLKDNLIYDGLHVLGLCVEGKRLEEMVYSLVKVGTPETSILEACRKYLSHRDSCPEELCEEIIRTMNELGFDSGRCKSEIGKKYGSSMLPAVERIISEVYPKLVKTDAEVINIINALEGKFIPPSPSGCPTRGTLDMLPTGRNFHSLDPYAIPWSQSWDIGVKHANQMLERHLGDHGSYPDNIGFILWDVETIRTGGEDISYILWLMGLEPVWSETGKVVGLNVVPLEILKRPRVDVTIRSSGLFRDTFPNLLDLLDEGIQMVADLDEGDEENHIRANVRMEVANLIKEGIPEHEARLRAGYRIFSAAPGQYGAGVIAAIVKSGWDSVSDLSELFIDYGCYAYGRDCFGKRSYDDFKRRLSKLSVTVKNHTTREMDLFDMDDEYDFLGGMNAAVRAISGKKPISYMGDSSDPNNLRTRLAEEESAYVFRSKLSNPEWIEGLKPFGYSGATKLSTTLEYVFAWDATSDIIEDWMFDEMAENFLLNEDTYEWLKRENPFAAQQMIQRLFEANQRGLWNTSEEMILKLKDLYLDVEGLIEFETDR